MPRCPECGAQHPYAGHPASAVLADHIAAIGTSQARHRITVIEGASQ